LSQKKHLNDITSIVFGLGLNLAGPCTGDELIVDDWEFTTRNINYCKMEVLLMHWKELPNGQHICEGSAGSPPVYLGGSGAQIRKYLGVVENVCN